MPKLSKIGDTVLVAVALAATALWSTNHHRGQAQAITQTQCNQAGGFCTFDPTCRNEINWPGWISVCTSTPAGQFHCCTDN
jgi:hypothetical protein